MAEETQGTVNEVEKTFTQSELNAIISDRISEVKSKYSDYDDLKTKAKKFDEAEEASKSELQKITEARDALQAELDTIKKAESIRQVRDKVATEKGVPANLLTADTEEACAAQAEAILSFAQKPDYPTVKDGGEVTPTGKKATRDQFAEWFNEIDR